jgi:hypothetical protein
MERRILQDIEVVTAVKNSTALSLVMLDITRLAAAGTVK